ncbi:MAG: hypothetical protein J4G05_01760 [Chlorobi bacterium]|nr:hypothetical protein [Chlorobiota bacterium]
MVLASLITTQTSGINRVDFSLGLDGQTRLELYNSMGEYVRTLVDDYLLPGEYSLTWKRGTLLTGVYFYRLTSGDYVSLRKGLIVE